MRTDQAGIPRRPVARRLIVQSASATEAQIAIVDIGSIGDARFLRPAASGRCRDGNLDWITAAVLRNQDHTDGRPQSFVMQAARHRSGAHPEGLAKSMTTRWCRGGHDEAGQIGE